jgi:DNA-binding CsgD family transcriptional regulator/tetratricopeptide (TPR) repeat protein
VDKSLLRQEEGPDGELRYLLLETVREFGGEQLVARGDEDVIKRRHAMWCLALAEQAEPELLGPEQRRWTERLEAEHANLRAGFNWLIETGATAEAHRLAYALWVFWFIRGHLREGYAWFEQALAAKGIVPADSSVRALWGAGMLAWSQGDNRQAEILGAKALRLAEADGLVFGRAVANYLIFLAMEGRGSRDEAVPYGEASVAYTRESGERAWLAYVLADVGTRLVERGERERGEAWIAEGLALHRELGNKQGFGNKLSDLGLASHEAGDVPAATRHYAESIRWLWESGDVWYLASPIGGLAVVALDAGHPEQAARLLGAAGILRERSGGAVWPDERGRLDRALTGARAALGDEVYGRAVAAGRELPLSEVVAEATAVATTYLTTLVSPDVDAFGLSPREQEVLKLLATGKSNPEIGRMLFIGSGTVKTHVSNILGKLDVSSRSEAIGVAHRKGLL